MNNDMYHEVLIFEKVFFSLVFQASKSSIKDHLLYLCNQSGKNVGT